MPGDDETYVAARSALFDALDALGPHANTVVLVGAQAIYLHTGAVALALAEATKDSDLAMDPRELLDTPLIEQAMREAGFVIDPVGGQPGAWRSPAGIPVDLMVPEALAGAAGRRAARMPPHARETARRASGLEAAMVDHAPMRVPSLSADDPRERMVRVAGPAALLVAKLHKLGEREASPTRLQAKDAHDVYRLLVATETDQIAAAVASLATDELAWSATEEAVEYLRRLFGHGRHAVGSALAGVAEANVGDPEQAAQAVTLLAQDLLDELDR